MGSIVFVSIRVPRNSHSDLRSGVRVHHCWDECCTPQQSLLIMVLHRIHGLMMVSNVRVERSATGATHVPNSRLTPTKIHTVTRNGPQFQFCLLKHLSCISITCPTPRPTTSKISCKEQIKMKFRVVLQENCDQSATVWWSKRSFAQNWSVGEWCLSWNESVDSSREPTWTIRYVALQWLVPLAREPPLL